jgi:hypothetical protein
MPLVIVALMWSIAFAATACGIYLCMDCFLRMFDFICHRLAVRRAKAEQAEHLSQMHASGLGSLGGTTGGIISGAGQTQYMPQQKMQQGNVLSLKCTRGPNHLGPCNGQPRGDCINGR